MSERPIRSRLGRRFPLAFPRAILIAAGLLALPALLVAQSSTNYNIEQGAINAGGNPAPVLTSTNYKITLDSVGDSVAGTGMSSTSYRSDCGFPPDYVPPEEVLNQRFSSPTLMTWDPEPSVGVYDVYRGLTTGFSGGSYGSCLQAGLTAASYTDSASPSSGQCWFYLVTAENRLGEQGTSGYLSDGSQRPITGACP